MNSKFKITIPKPCHENWNTMSPKEKGKFCSSCSKTVVDFTKKSITEIQEYLVENKNQKVCGHFYKKQLDTITIEIPQVTFQQQLSFQKLFVLALFLVMGTTLFSCQYSDGKKQNIENVVIKDSIKIIEEDVGLISPSERTIDSLQLEKDSIIITKKIKTPPASKTTGIIICETPIKKDSIINPTSNEEVVEIIETLGILTIEGDINYEEIEENEDVVFGFVIIEETPRFKTSKNLSKEESKKDFDTKMKNFVQENFDAKLTQCLDLNEGKYRIQTQFVIDENGNTIDIKVRAPHPKLKKEVTKMLQKLPLFIPGRQRNRAVKTRYTLPISFEVK